MSTLFKPLAVNCFRCVLTIYSCHRRWTASIARALPTVQRLKPYHSMMVQPANNLARALLPTVITTTIHRSHSYVIIISYLFDCSHHISFSIQHQRKSKWVLRGRFWFALMLNTEGYVMAYPSVYSISANQNESCGAGFADGNVVMIKKWLSSLTSTSLIYYHYK